MPTITITAFDSKRLPSPLTLTSWVHNWQAAGPAGSVWGAFNTQGSKATAQVNGATVGQVDPIVDNTVNQYNLTHTGNDTITAIVS